MQFFKLFFIALVVFFLMDMIWLGFVAKSYYLKAYQPWLRLSGGGVQALWWAGLIVYLLFGLAIVVLVVPLAQGSIVLALLYGAFLGLVIYGVYDFTCLAIFKDWPVGMAFVDWAWGTFLCMVTSGVVVYFAQQPG